MSEYHGLIFAAAVPERQSSPNALAQGPRHPPSCPTMNEPAGTGPIAFVCAMPMELTPLVERLGLEQTEIEGFAVHRGTLGDFGICVS